MFDNKHFAHRCVSDFAVGWGNSMEGSNELLFNQAWSDKCILGRLNLSSSIQVCSQRSFLQHLGFMNFMQ